MPRSLPKKNNPHVLSGKAPSFESLIASRRLGKTNLVVKPTQIGTSNATKPENLGLFEYAHLRAPLPKDLQGSEIFPSHTAQQHPETYFLMRRSKDGYVSATGMFKIAFPWAKLDEEKAEREYLRSREETSEDETAGNVWISPSLALEIGKEYQMYDWVRALLDPAEIVKGQSSSAKKQITPPPKFEMPAGDTPQLSPTRTRSRRSASPSKKAGSPRKSRQTRAKDVGTPGTAAANETLQSALDVSAAATDTPSLNGTVATSVEADGEGKAAAGEKKAKSASKSKKTTRAAAKDEEKEVKVEAESDVDVVEGAETSKKAVSVEMPIIPEAPSADDTKEMIAKAKEMVQEASQAPGPASKKSTKEAKKRKTEDLSDEEEDEEALAQRTKRARVLENKLKQERVRNRALVGVTAAFALAASIPYFF